MSDNPITWSFAATTNTRAPFLLDLRSLNEAEAGQSGFVRLCEDGNGFVLGNGDPVRFWAVSCGESGPQLDAVADWLARIGVNLVRICSSPDSFATLSPKGEGSCIDDVDTDAVEKAWRMVAALKRRGIYTLLTPYWVSKGSDVSDWGIDDYTGVSGGRDGLWGLLFFNQRLQAAYRGWLRALLEPENPYTGTPLAEDPAVAMILLQNEDSLFWWTVDKMGEAQRALLEERFAAWARTRYGGLEQAYQAWCGARLRNDDPASRRLGFYPLREATRPQEGGKRRRLSDQVAFWGETMHRFNTETRRYLREELGCRQLLIAENWKTASPARLLDAERWVYTATDVIAKNQYFSGHHEGARAKSWILEGDIFTNRSALLHPAALPANMKQVVGHPHLLTESSWVNPDLYQTEGPMMTAAYLSLSGMAGYVWFVSGPGYEGSLAAANTGPTPEEEGSGAPGGYGAVFDSGRRFPRKWEIAQPTLAGMFPAAALAYRRGDIRTAPSVVHEERALADVLGLDPPTIWEDPDFDPNRDDEGAAETAGNTPRTDPLAFLVGRVETVFGGDPERTRVSDLSPYIDRNAQTVRSVTGEINLDYGRGILTLDTPRTQGVCGFLQHVGRFLLSEVTIESKDAYAAVMAVSLDGEAISRSAKILLQIGTTARPTGWKTEPCRFTPRRSDAEVVGERILETGRPPWQVANSHVTVSIRNPALKRVRQLDREGKLEREIPAEREHDTLHISLPPDGMTFLLD